MHVTRSVFALFLLLAGSALAKDYHVDSTAGNDSAPGTSPAQAWKSLEKVNATEFTAGDRLLFKAGGRWSGQLHPKGSGRANGQKVEPVIITRYGEGPLPRIDGEGKVTDTVLLENIQFWEVTDLEITNQGPQTAPWRTGVRILADGIGTMQYIALRRLYVHDVNGDLRKSNEGCGIYFEAKGRGTFFDRLLIENCKLERTDRNGICQRGHGGPHSRSVIIRGNTLDDIGGDGIKLWGTDGGLIEKNIVRKARARAKDAAAGIWPFDCNDTVIQFNEVSGTLGTLDGQGFDSDYGCRRTLIQYNYSHDNEGGFILICGPGNSFNSDTVIRYNISVHDGVDSARVFHFGGKSTNTRVYHNTIVLGPQQKVPVLLFTDWDKGFAEGASFTNNLVITSEGGKALYKFGPDKGTTFEGNVFAGVHEGLPAGTAASKTVPKLKGPLEPADGLAAAERFKPAPTDRNFPRGNVIKDNGGRDFFGKPLRPTDRPAIGAAEP